MDHQNKRDVKGDYMGTAKKIRRIVAGSHQVDGAGVKLVRVIGRADVEEFDPFLMLDAFDSRNPADYIKGFPWHPHRGIETVTYLIAGDIEHGDSLGNKGHILDGGCQWMTAGSGIIHQEMPQPAERMLGLQLWLNLPSKDKWTRPQYRDITAALIPKVQEESGTVGVISGTYNKVQGATQGDYVKALMLDIELKPEADWRLPVDSASTLFIYIVKGGAFFQASSTQVESHRAVLFGEGDEFTVQAGPEGIRFVLFSGRPLREPIAWGGPIVMNTQEELQQAFADMDNGTFIRATKAGYDF
jgi:redox-sensitive bicupin YhaK (pirin superfamily)